MINTGLQVPSAMQASFERLLHAGFFVGVIVGDSVGDDVGDVVLKQPPLLITAASLFENEQCGSALHDFNFLIPEHGFSSQSFFFW